MVAQGDLMLSKERNSQSRARRGESSPASNGFERVDGFRQTLQLLHRVTGVDFGQYNPKIVQQRIRRQMALQHFDQLAAYLPYLHGHEEEVDNLYRHLIGETNFFRDTTFTVLKKKVDRK